MYKELAERFRQTFGKECDPVLYFAPGRVNLIGEHTDYNGGHVFPCALSLGTYAVARKRSDNTLRFFSKNLAKYGVTKTTLGALTPGRAFGWASYPEGVLWSLKNHGYTPPCGMDLLIYGTIPHGSGLSSSASIEVLTAMVAKEMYGFTDLTMKEISVICQEAENKYNRVNCGIMDQFASAMGEKEHALFLDTNTLDYESVPLTLSDTKLVIVNSRVKHSLVSSAYNERRAQCEEALSLLKGSVRIDSLGELNAEQYEAHKGVLTDPVIEKRAHHAVYENLRTISAKEALEAGDLALFGRLMNESHDSLRYDYEVSCEEIDFLVDEARKCPGVLGSRITGGGFGGCTVNLVKSSEVDEFIYRLTKGYRRKFKKKPGIILAETSGHFVIRY